VFFEFGTAKVSDCYKRIRLFLYQWFKKMYRVMSGKKPSHREGIYAWGIEKTSAVAKPRFHLLLPGT
jgi:hypothetical protein